MDRGIEAGQQQASTRRGNASNARLLAGLTALVVRHRRRMGAGREAAIWRRARDRDGLSDASALSWDLADWNWKQNHDAGLFYETLFAADLQVEAQGRQASVLRRRLPSDAIRGEPAGELGVEGQSVAHRDQAAQGHHVPGEARRDGGARIHRRGRAAQLQSPRQESEKIAGYFDHLAKVHAPDHTVVFEFKEFNAEWDYRFGWGYYSGDAEGGPPTPAQATGRTATAPGRSC